MADSNQNLVQFRLTGTLSVSGTNVKVSNDILRDTAINVANASITLQNEGGTTFELVKGTITGGELTTSKRGITEDQTLTEDATLKREWRPGTIGFITSFASDSLDVDSDGQLITIKNDITFTGDNVFNGGVEFNNTMNIPTFANTTARDLVYTVPVNGDKCFIIGTGEQVYNGGTWETLDIGTPTANASETVAGKVEIATTAQSKSANDTGETGALLSVLPSDIAKNTQSGTFTYGVDIGRDDTYVVALTPALTAYTTGQRLTATLTTTNTGACTIDFGPGVKNIKLIDGRDPLTGDITAGGTYDFVYDGTNIILQTVVMGATDAEALAGTVENKFINPKQAQSVILPIAGTTLTAGSAPTSRQGNSGTVKLKEILIKATGTYTVTFTVSTFTNIEQSARIYKNGFAYGTNRVPPAGTWSENLSFNAGDLCQLYIYSTNAFYVTINNFLVQYSPSILGINGTVNLN